MNYLLDTNICIHIIKKKPLAVFQIFESMLPFSNGISSITIAELEYEVRKSNFIEQNKAPLQQFLTPFSIFSFYTRANSFNGIVSTEPEKNGSPTGSLDILIAADALSLNCTLASNNTKEFKRVPYLLAENCIK